MSRKIMPWVFSVALFVCIGVAALAVVAQEVTVPVKCNEQGICIIPAAYLAKLIEAHNEQVLEIRRLEALTRKCPVKTEKNA